MNIKVTNTHNGQQYPAVAQHWPEHGWSFQIHDPTPGTWGRAPSGVGTGSVIDQGFQKELEQRGWQFPPLTQPENVRDAELKRLAGRLSGAPRAEPPEPYAVESRAAQIVSRLLDS